MSDLASEILARLRAGESLGGIARVLGCSRSLVRQVKRAAWLSDPHYRPPRRIDAPGLAAFLDTDAGRATSVAELADRFGVSLRQAESARYQARLRAEAASLTEATPDPYGESASYPIVRRVAAFYRLKRHLHARGVLGDDVPTFTREFA